MTSISLKHPPRVLVPACRGDFDGLPAYHVGEKYLDALRGVGLQPWIVAAASPDEVPGLLAGCDGVLLTGSASNVHPSHFGQPVRDAALPLDPARDAWVLPLVVQAIEAGVPLLGICRGFHEINVALGGSLHQAVHEVHGLDDHRPRPEADEQATYGPAHDIAIAPGGLLSELLGEGVAQVNSVHGQGVQRLAPTLRVEARAPDGLVEAFSLKAARAFTLAVQWHPEWRARDNPMSMKLLQAFGRACSLRLARRVPGTRA